MGICDSRELPKFNRKQFEIITTQLRTKIMLEKDRKILQLEKAEKELGELLSMTNKNRDAIISQANTCLNMLRWIESSKILIRDLKTILDKSIWLEALHKERQPLGEFEPLIHTVIWGKTRLNILEINNFIREIEMYFDPHVVRKVETEGKVDLKLKKYFKSLMNTPVEIHGYLGGFVERNGLAKEVLKDISGDFNAINLSIPDPRFGGGVRVGGGGPNNYAP
jgi:hypothetical protein